MARMRETQLIVRLTVKLTRCLCPNQCLIDVSLQEIYPRQAQIGIGLPQFVLKRKRGSECAGKKSCRPVKLLFLIDRDMGKAELSVNFTEHIIGRLIHLLSAFIPYLGFGEVPSHALYIGQATVGVCFMNGVTRFLKEVRCLLVGVYSLFEHTALQGDMP